VSSARPYGPRVILACGKAKHAGRHPAIELYRGGLFVLGARWARSVTTLDRIWVLSARYGLVRAAEPIDSYDLRLGAPGSVTVDQLARQVAHAGAELAELVIVQGGRDYAELARAVLPSVVWLRDRMDTPGKGIGYQLQWLKAHQGVCPRMTNK
jgi:hypothetical protein